MVSTQGVELGPLAGGEATEPHLEVERFTKTWSLQELGEPPGHLVRVAHGRHDLLHGRARTVGEDRDRSPYGANLCEDSIGGEHAGHPYPTVDWCPGFGGPLREDPIEDLAVQVEGTASGKPFTEYTPV
jgi:hypothetical protein